MCACKYIITLVKFGCILNKYMYVCIFVFFQTKNCLVVTIPDRQTKAQPLTIPRSFPYLSARYALGCEARKEIKDIAAKVPPICGVVRCRSGDTSSSGSSVICDPDMANQNEPFNKTIFLSGAIFFNSFQDFIDTPEEVHSDLIFLCMYVCMYICMYVCKYTYYLYYMHEYEKI